MLINFIFFFFNNKFFPRDTRDQIKVVHKKKSLKSFNRGDIIYWKGHVAVCIDKQKLIHAYGPKKKVLIKYKIDSKEFGSLYNW